MFPLHAQIMEGELRVVVRDPAGRPVEAAVEISGRNPEFRTESRTNVSGVVSLQRLPLGIYRLVVRHQGFEQIEDIVEIRSAVPVMRVLTLTLAAIRMEVAVAVAPPLVDPLQPMTVMQAGRQQLAETPGTTLGRSTIDVIASMPGWLLEANAVVHPRGSEYDTQYVIDGMPLYDNRSIAVAPPLANDEFEAVNVLTSGIPAEYGRRLGGVIALDTRRVDGGRPRSDITLQSGSFRNNIASIMHQFRMGRRGLALGIHGGRTDRYLDPPSLENFTNKGNSGGFNLRFDQDITDRDRINLYLRSNRARFQVPNDPVQQRAGQQQDRRTDETDWHGYYQHVFSSRTLAAAKGMIRDVRARLWSNSQSIPVFVEQDRGFREGAAVGHLTVEGSRHTLKLGGDLRLNNIREEFRMAEPDELPEFDIEFNGRERSREASAFIQDVVRLGNFAANFGLRYDHYRLLIESNTFSPRLAASYYFSRADIQLHASYDRVFQPPPIENLLLSSRAPQLDIDEIEDALAVPASRGNFFEAGFRKAFWNVLRIDASHYWRRFRNYLDDDVFLQTGISLPITFDEAEIEGTEIRVELPAWKNLSGYLSYSNMLGRARSPVTGGLFIEGGEAGELRHVVEDFSISQDQRNTLATQLRFEPHERIWFAVGTRYGSGLPVELAEDDDSGDDSDSALHDQIDFERGRIRPNLALNSSIGLRIWEQDSRSAHIQLDARNVTNRLNVINFTGLFSGTAIAPGRQFAAQLRLRF
ncbi:MAG: TonB-dependent receptor [Acidobacteria bacterium]|nr:TonB-dependent receptor [Acidobacteriota bacterium]